MQYGHFDGENREYVIERVDLPTSWTNYLGVEDTCVVINHTAGGYMFYKSPEYHRITRFRGNGVPMDRPGHYVYIRDMEDGDYFSISWQPVGKPLDQAKYTCRHGLSYSTYECDYKGIHATQRLMVPLGDAVELWDVKIRNTSDQRRNLQVFSYCEFSFHHILMDNQNFQMSLYAAGSRYEDGIIEHDLFYEEEGYQYFTGNFEPDGFDCLRDTFLGTYHSESDPQAVVEGVSRGSFEKGNNHCASLQKQLTLEPGEEVRLVFMLGEGDIEAGKRIREKYRDPGSVDEAFRGLKEYWQRKLSMLQIQTPNQNMNTMINTWNLYQAEINIMFSRFASFIEVGGRTGLGYRDTAQDAMTVIHSNPEKCRQRILELMKGLTSKGYGLHLFQPEWFEKEGNKKPFKSPTVVPKPDAKSILHGLEDACSDDALWLVSTVVEYIKETGEYDLLEEKVCFADTFAQGDEFTVYEHLKRILDFSTNQVGEDGVCLGLRADWNDCLNLGGGESAMVSFLHYWALENFISLARYMSQKTSHLKSEIYAEEADYYEKIAQRVKEICNRELWDQDWYIRGITKNGKRIGVAADLEGKVHLESNSWAVLSGAAEPDKGKKAMDSVREYLFTPYGIMLNAPCYTKPDDDIGFVTRVYPGLKENGAVFSHSNPWAWAAECVLGRGDRAMEFYDALCPGRQNDMIEIRQAEPYSYCQFVVGRDHTAYGRARHPFMTGSGGWAYFAATHYMLGIQPGFDALEIDPCIPKAWDQFRVNRKWRGAEFDIHIENPQHVSKGVSRLYLDGEQVTTVGVQQEGTQHIVRVVMG